MLAFDFSDGSSSTFVVRGGAGSLANAGTDLYSSTASRQQELAAGAASTSGEIVDTATLARLERRLWLRLQ